MKRTGLIAAGFLLAGCAGTGNSPLDNQPGTRFNSAGASGGTATSTQELKPAAATDPVAHDADDPAIWVNRLNPTQSLILGTDKVESVGALYAFNLEGKTVQKIEGLDRPNNVDVGYDLSLGAKTVDFAILTERKAGKLRIYSIDNETGKLEDISGNTSILGEETGSAKEPMGIAVYRREDGAQFAIVAPKTGGKTNYLAQYRLVPNNGKIDLKLVRRFGAFSGVDKDGNGEIEAICVDQKAGVVYYSDELAGIRKYWADPERPGADKELATFGTEGYKADREGLALYETSPQDGFLLSVDQVEKKSRVFVYTRGGANESDQRNTLVAAFETPADTTDGMEATSRDLGVRYPQGILVMMDSGNKRFLIFDWRDIAPRLMKRQTSGAANR
ncbi:MAG: phytase [Armatimonadetes bacterium]|nr:phytase [Armatimonadota bacterium]MBX3107986.1 phytase [Fimbriimonadaceae bacterium]